MTDSYLYNPYFWVFILLYANITGAIHSLLFSMFFDLQSILFMFIWGYICYLLMDSLEQVGYL